ncbi:MAG: hypothetical protein KQH59_18600 [Desulfobulbaceae bacterium]|nr:hypothetical protein [Desulfobulbaceae bacterium]
MRIRNRLFGLFSSLIVVATFVAMVLGPIFLVANSSGPVAGWLTVPPHASLNPLDDTELPATWGSQLASGVIPISREEGR